MTDYFYWQKSTFGKWQPCISFGEPPVAEKGYAKDAENFSHTTPKVINPLVIAAGTDKADLLQSCIDTWPHP